MAPPCGSGGWSWPDGAAGVAPCISGRARRSSCGSTSGSRVTTRCGWPTCLPPPNGSGRGGRGAGRRGAARLRRPPRALGAGRSRRPRVLRRSGPGRGVRRRTQGGRVVPVALAPRCAVLLLRVPPLGSRAAAGGDGRRRGGRLRRPGPRLWRRCAAGLAELEPPGARTSPACARCCCDRCLTSGRSARRARRRRPPPPSSRCLASVLSSFSLSPLVRSGPRGRAGPRPAPEVVQPPGERGPARESSRSAAAVRTGRFRGPRGGRARRGFQLRCSGPSGCAVGEKGLKWRAVV